MCDVQILELSLIATTVFHTQNKKGANLFLFFLTKK